MNVYFLTLFHLVYNPRIIYANYIIKTGLIHKYSFMFTKKGTVLLENNGADEDKVMEDCFEAGADDFNVEEEIIEVSCQPNDVTAVSEALKGMGYSIMSAESEMVPSTYTTLTDEKQLKMMGMLLDNLEENDDVQNVYHNWNMPEEEEED